MPNDPICSCGKPLKADSSDKDLGGDGVTNCYVHEDGTPECPTTKVPSRADLYERIAELEAENETVTRSRDGWKVDCSVAAQNSLYHAERAEAAKAERDNFRSLVMTNSAREQNTLAQLAVLVEALETIKSKTAFDCHDFIESLWKIADNALSNLPAAGKELVEKVKAHTYVSEQLVKMVEHRDRLAEVLRDILPLIKEADEMCFGQGEDGYEMLYSIRSEVIHNIEAALSPAPEAKLIVHDKGCPAREQRGECTCKPTPEQGATETHTMNDQDRKRVEEIREALESSKRVILQCPDAPYGAETVNDIHQAKAHLTQLDKSLEWEGEAIEALRLLADYWMPWMEDSNVSQTMTVNFGNPTIKSIREAKRLVKRHEEGGG